MLEWVDNYKLGIESVDREHRQQFELLNRAYAVLRDISSEDRYEQISFIISELIDYSEGHFESEEAYMLRVAYPGYFDHKIAHSRLIRELKIKLLEFNSMYTSDISRVLNYTSDWLLDHILEEDSKLVDFSNK